MLIQTHIQIALNMYSMQAHTHSAVHVYDHRPQRQPKKQADKCKCMHTCKRTHRTLPHWPDCPAKLMWIAAPCTVTFVPHIFIQVSTKATS